MRRPDHSPNIVRGLFLAAGIALLLPNSPSLCAAPLPPELNLVPREASLFVSIRVADLWNDARLKPLREFMEKDPKVAGHFERKFGFRLTDLERFSMIMPGRGADERHGLGEPCVVLTLRKPFDLGRVLDAFEALPPDEWRKAQDERMKPANPRMFKKDFPFEPKKPVPPPMPDFKDDKIEINPQFVNADRDEEDHSAKKKRQRNLNANYYVFQDGFLVPIDNRTFVLYFSRPFGGGEDVTALLAALLRRSDDGPLTPALEAAAGKSALVIGCNPRAIRDALPKKEWAELLPIPALLSSRSALLTADAGEELKLTLRIDAGDEKTAKRVHDVLKSSHVLFSEMIPGIKKLARSNAESKEDVVVTKMFFDLFEPLFKSAEFERHGNSITATMKTKVELEAWTKILTTAIENLRDEAEKAKEQNYFKQIGLGVVNYHDKYARFPFPGISAPKGQPQAALPYPKPNLSWRVAILPFIDQQNLYLQFHLDEPWDSDHNKKLIPEMPKIYAPPNKPDAPKGHTHLRMFNSPGTYGTASRIVEITDGLSNTIMVVESSELVPWTKPDDFFLDPKKPKAKLGLHNGKFSVLLGDGSVRRIDLSKISDDTLRAAITIDGGEVLPSDW